jgi:hypothetical protein
MATINDFGGLNDPLSNPPLGGPQGWAAAIRDAVRAIQTSAAGRGATYATEAARNTALPNPSNGMFCYITALQQFQAYDGGWYPVVNRQTVQPIALNGTWFRDFPGMAGLSALKMGRLVHVGGAIENFTANEFPAGSAIGDMPDGWQPAGVVTTWALGDNNTHYRLNVGVDGQIAPQGNAIPAHTWMAFDVQYLAAA